MYLFPPTCVRGLMNKQNGMQVDEAFGEVIGPLSIFNMAINMDTRISLSLPYL